MGFNSDSLSKDKIPKELMGLSVRCQTNTNQLKKYRYSETDRDFHCSNIFFKHIHTGIFASQASDLLTLIFTLADLVQGNG